LNVPVDSLLVNADFLYDFMEKSLRTMESIMKRYRVISDAGLPDSLQLQDFDPPALKPHEVRIAVKACSLNFRDTMIAKGGYTRNKTRPVVPLSDGAGEIVECGAEVHGWRQGDRVMVNFLRDWIAGPVSDAALRSGLGGGIDGMLAQTVAIDAAALVRIPDHLNYQQASTLPCAAVTAYNALSAAGTTAGDNVLLLGTGGVSIFGLQICKALGARTIITSSSDDKLAKARQIGADEMVNYRTHPEWQDEVRRLTNGDGVDHVIEVGGTGTLGRSMKATRVGGTISLIGVLGQGEPNMTNALMNAQTIRGIYVGSVEMFSKLNRLIEYHKVEPVIDKVFPFDQAHAAYEYLTSQNHVGKVVIEVAS
jgi:NADPH:quinone reductase-like Zn-dependent oxidoreductase